MALWFALGMAWLACVGSSSAAEPTFAVEAHQCAAVRSRLDAFRARQAESPLNERTLVLRLPSGFGDQLSGLLGGIALAAATGRRLVLSRPPDAPPFLGSELLPTFPITYDDSIVESDEPRVACADRAAPPAALRKNANTNLFCAHSQINKVAHASFAKGFSVFFEADTEYVTPGNAGNTLFRLWLAEEGIKPGGGSSAQSLMACAARSAQKLSKRATAAVHALSPWGEDRPPVVVGIHVRAHRYLGDYSLSDAAFTDCAAEAGITSDHFARVWEAAHEIEERLSPGRAGKPGVKWFLVTDSRALKAAASRAFPDKVVVSQAVPRHNVWGTTDCARAKHAHPSKAAKKLNLTANEETVAELFLLAGADAILQAVDSRFSAAAAFFCEKCRHVVKVLNCSQKMITYDDAAGCAREPSREGPALLTVDLLEGTGLHVAFR
ncbi:hypothetical protein M885DRAFT_101973 [Pelagophyceae sp. CCMP2097]|nr:hypothetical protein M885DRAFT_101973 [Pelagophyceae sp. CCMP2097]